MTLAIYALSYTEAHICIGTEECIQACDVYIGICMHICIYNVYIYIKTYIKTNILCIHTFIHRGYVCTLRKEKYRGVQTYKHTHTWT